MTQTKTVNNYFECKKEEHENVLLHCPQVGTQMINRINRMPHMLRYELEQEMGKFSLYT